MGRKILSVLLITILCFIIIEGLLALTIKIKYNLENWQESSGLFIPDSLLGWKGRPNTRVKVRSFESNFQVITDKSGFRNCETENSKTDVLIFGDSFIWGYGVDNDKTLTFCVSKKTGLKLKNYGMIGYGTDQEYILMKDITDDADIIIVSFYINDLRDIIADNMETSFPGKPKYIVIDDSLVLQNYPVGEKKLMKEPMDKKEEFISFKHRFSESIKKLLYTSHIFRIAASYIQYTSIGRWMYKKNLMEIPEYMHYDWRVADEEIVEKALPVFDKLSLKIKEYAESRNARLIFIVIPSEFQYQKKLLKQMNILKINYGYENGIDAAMGQVCGILEKNGIEYLYPLEKFKAENVISPLTFKFDKHFSVRGNELMADLLVDYLKKDEL